MISRALQHSLSEERDCILCGKCLEVCPLFAATGQEELSPRGKSFLIRKTLMEQTLGDPAAGRKLLGLCLGCGRCADVCPQGRNLPETLRTLRAEHPGWQGWIWGTWISKARQIWPWAEKCARLVPHQTAAGSIFAGLQALGAPARAPAMLQRIGEKAALPIPSVLFPGCMARFARPGWIESALRLAGAGDELGDFPDWNCCGFTLGQAGLTTLRSAACAHNVQSWRDLGRPTVLTICATCTASLRGYGRQPGLFESEAELRSWAASIQPLSGFLTPTDFCPTAQGAHGLVYHRPCHAPSPDPDEEFLQGVFGARFSAGPKTSCCGMGGVMRLSAPDLSFRVARHCWSALGSMAPKDVVSGCSGCVVQLTASAPQGVRVAHWLELCAT